jgi:hypothetical protein
MSPILEGILHFRYHYSFWKKLSTHAWTGTQRTEGQTSLCNWPNQGQPSKPSWDTWRKYLKILILGRGMRLWMDLGPWIRQDYNIWKWYYSPLHEGLIQITTEKEILLYTRQVPSKNKNLYLQRDTTFNSAHKTHKSLCPTFQEKPNFINWHWH